MASANIVLASAQQPIKAELLSVLTTSDEQITNHIYATHVHADDNNFDEVSLFAIMENILKCATIVVDNVILIYIYIYIYIYVTTICTYSLMRCLNSHEEVLELLLNN